MDDHRFDALARTLRSRRTAVAGVLGGLTALLGLAVPEEAVGHNALARCRRIPSGTRRQACLRRARAHNRTCHPQPVAVTCAGRCGLWNNNCGLAVACQCPTGLTCLSNGGCGRVCDPDFGICPDGCVCAQPSTEGPTVCQPSGLTCEQIPQICSSTAECPLGWFCQTNSCFGPPNNRCTPACAG